MFSPSKMMIDPTRHSRAAQPLTMALGMAHPGSLLSFQPSPGSSIRMKMVRMVQVWKVTFSMDKICSPFACTQIVFALKELHTHGVCIFVCATAESAHTVTHHCLCPHSNVHSIMGVIKKDCPISLRMGTRCCCLAFGTIPQTGTWDLPLERLAHTKVCMDEDVQRAACKRAAIEQVIYKGDVGSLCW